MQEARNLSAHERRMQRMAERARKLEAQNVGDKEWFMRGEADSGLCLYSMLSTARALLTAQGGFAPHKICHDSRQLHIWAGWLQVSGGMIRYKCPDMGPANTPCLRLPACMGGGR